jgi:shikimate kinase
VIDRAANQNILRESAGSFIVFLDAPFQILIDRCLQQEQEGGATYRPLLHKTEIARMRYEERRVLYANHAQRGIDVARQSPELVAQEIWRAVFELMAVATYKRHASGIIVVVCLSASSQACVLESLLRGFP